jgi:hypothetical protein
VSPNGDGYADAATIRYSLAEAAAVTVTLDDALGLTVIAPLYGVRQKAGKQQVRLDATVVPDGRYRVLVAAVGNGGGKSSLTGELTVNRTLGWLRVDPPLLAVTPTGESTVTVSFELATAALVTAEIRDQGTLLAVVFGEWLEAGRMPWLERRAAGGADSAGLYEIWVTAPTPARHAARLSHRLPAHPHSRSTPRGPDWAGQ